MKRWFRYRVGNRVKMLPTTPLKTERRLQKLPAVCPIRTCPDGCKPTYLGVAIGGSLVTNTYRTWQNSAIHIVHPIMSLCRNPNPNKSDMNRGILPRKKTNMAFCLRSSVVQMCKELRESLATAYQT